MVANQEPVAKRRLTARVCCVAIALWAGLVIIAVPFTPAAAAAPPPNTALNSTDAILKWINNYRHKPEPDNLPAVVRTLSAMQAFKDAESSGPYIGFIAGVLGSIVAAVGFFLWAGHVTSLSLGAQAWYVVVTGAGMGMLIGPSNTDAVNRAGRLSYGEATGITQTVRNYGSRWRMRWIVTVVLEAGAARLRKRSRSL